MQFEHDGYHFAATGVSFMNKWLAVIYRTDGEGKPLSRGIILTEPDATKPSGPWVLLDSQAAAEQAGYDFILGDFLRP